MAKVLGGKAIASSLAAIGLVGAGFAGAGVLGCQVLSCSAGRSPAPLRTPTAPRHAVLAVHPVAAPRNPRGGRAQLRAELRDELRKAGPGSGAYVYDLTTSQPVFSVRAGTGRPPASVEKLYTSVALLTDLGAQARLLTKVLGTGFLGRGGVWHGDLYLRGGGDPTFGSSAFNRVWEHGYGSSISDLASQLAGRGIRSVTGQLIGDESQFDTLRGGPSTRLAPDLGDLGGELSALSFNHGESGGTGRGAISPAELATQQLALALHGAHIQVAAAPRTGVTPRRARALASVRSPPVSVLLRLMNVPSDDFYAELLTKMLGLHAEGTGSTAAGARAIASAVAGFGVHPRIVDGSGLSRVDRSSPLEVVDLLRAMWSSPSLGDVLRASLPVIGVSGTVRRMATGTAAQGRCVAKTGTLNYVSNLAGYCAGAGHQELAFAIFLDGPDNQQGLTVEGRIVATLVKLDAARP